MLPAKESLTVEFKSEQKRPQSHDEIVDTVVALANTEGGTLYLGIEDDGTVTGVCDEHRNINGLAVLIFNKTVPQLPARVALLVGRFESRLTEHVEKPYSQCQCAKLVVVFY